MQSKDSGLKAIVLFKISQPDGATCQLPKSAWLGLQDNAFFNTWRKTWLRNEPAVNFASPQVIFVS